MQTKIRDLWAGVVSRYDLAVIFCLFSMFYMFLAWIVCGGERWWIIDYVDNSNIFYGDDAYRFFLAKSAWINADLYFYNFVLPGFLLLDGAVTTLAGGDLLLSRCIHAALGAAGLCLVWDISRQLGMSVHLRVAILLLMGLLPRYALMSLSFYGEVWVGFLLCLIAWLFLRQQFLAMAVVTSLLPLIRAEGLFFLAPLFAFMVMKRRWTSAAVMILPGFVYFILLNVHFDALQDFSHWRTELRQILNRLVMNKSDWDIVTTYSLGLTLPALLGWLYEPVRRLWPILLGAALYLAFLVISVPLGYMTYEDRYTYILIPILVVLWGGFFSWLLLKIPVSVVDRRARAILVLWVALLVVGQHFINMAQIKRGIQAFGFFRTADILLSGRWHYLFSHHTPSQVQSRQLLSRKIEDVVRRDRGIDKVVIFDSGFYYALDPLALPRHVTVGYLTNGYMVFHALLNGQTFIQHPGGKMYSYLHYGKPDFSQDEKRLLCVDLMPLVNYPYAWVAGGYEVYLFSYKESRFPARDLDKAPMLTPSMLDQMYRSWVLPQ